MLVKTLKVIVLALSMFVALTGADLLYGFYDLRNDIVFALRVADLESDQELRKKVFAVAMRAGVRCEERDILIERTNSRVRAEVPYSYMVGVPFAGSDRLNGGARFGWPLALRASGERAL